MTNPIDGLRDGTLLAAFDRLLADQGRLLFAKGNYDEEAATAYGVQLLDFMRLHGEKVREAIAGAPDLLRALRDAERYRWLRKNVLWQPMPVDTQGAVYLVATMVSNAYGDCDVQTDEAIDAAMQRSGDE